MSGIIRYAAAACQTDLANPVDRLSMRRNTDRMLSMIESAVAGSAPFLPVRLVVFPEFAHAAPVFPTAGELLDKLALPVPNEHTDRLERAAREHGIYIQSGSMIEVDPRWPEVVFNTTCLIGPEGLLYRYRKVNPWIPYEVHASPHDIEDYPDPLFPVADTPIGRIGCAICYDWLFPEAMRQLAANGAEVLVRVSAYMDPWGATEPLSWWTIVNRCRALENTAFVVAANQGASLKHYPPYSWPGGSQIVDFDGRMLAEASPGPGERIVVAPIDITALRHERETRRGHSTLAHLRTEAYPVYSTSRYPPAPRTPAHAAGLSYERNLELIEAAKHCTDPSVASGFRLRRGSGGHVSRKEATGEEAAHPGTSASHSLPADLSAGAPAKAEAGSHTAREQQRAPEDRDERNNAAARENTQPVAPREGPERYKQAARENK
jgi:predicted amidohydrolase